jgi:hypothetical protein
MKDVMKIRIAVSMLVLTMSAISHGQAIPAGGSAMSAGTTGPNVTQLDGVLHYAVTASEIIQDGYYGPGEVTHGTALSGDVAYTAKSETLPFNMLFAGGIIFGNQSGQGTNYYLNTSVSQGLVTRGWVFNIADSVTYLPQSPTTGLTGIPGVGDLGSLPVQGPSEGPAGGVLSDAGNRVGNSLSGGVERRLNQDTSISGSGSWSILHFLGDSDGLDFSQVSGTVALNRHLDARTSVSLDAVYSTFNYSNTGTQPTEPDIETRGINVSFQRLLSRTLSVNISAGPQWVSSSNSALIPASVDVAITAGLSYQRGFTSAALGYSRGVNGGSGVLPGALSDSISGSLAHTYGRKWLASINGAYVHTSGLTQLSTGTSIVPTNEVYNTIFGGAQLTRRFGTHFSGYVSYGAQNQTTNYSLAAQNAIIGTSQTFGIGVTFSPRSTRLGQF